MLIPAVAVPFYSICLLLVAACACFRLKASDTATRIVCVWIWFTSIKLATGRYLMQQGQSCLPFYQLAGLVDFGLIIVYLHFSTFRPIGKTWLTRLAVAGMLPVAAGLAGALSQTVGNTSVLFIENVFAICLLLYGLYYRLIRPDTRPTDDFHFLASGIFLLYKCSSIWTWWTHYQLSLHVAGSGQGWYATATLTDTLAYLAMGWILFYYPNLPKSHV